jgi:hypothetical protein
MTARIAARTCDGTSAQSSSGMGGSTLMPPI